MFNALTSPGVRSLTSQHRGSWGWGRSMFQYCCLIRLPARGIRRQASSFGRRVSHGEERGSAWISSTWKGGKCKINGTGWNRQSRIIKRTSVSWPCKSICIFSSFFPMKLWWFVMYPWLALGFYSSRILIAHWIVENTATIWQSPSVFYCKFCRGPHTKGMQLTIRINMNQPYWSTILISAICLSNMWTMVDPFRRRDRGDFDVRINRTSEQMDRLWQAGKSSVSFKTTLNKWIMNCHDSCHQLLFFFCRRTNVMLEGPYKYPLFKYVQVKSSCFRMSSAAPWKSTALNHFRTLQTNDESDKWRSMRTLETSWNYLTTFKDTPWSNLIIWYSLFLYFNQAFQTTQVKLDRGELSHFALFHGNCMITHLNWMGRRIVGNRVTCRI